MIRIGRNQAALARVGDALRNRGARERPMTFEHFDRGIGSIRVVRAAYAAGRSQAEHTHAYDSITIVLSGSVHESAARREHVLGPGAVLVKPRGTPHADRYDDSPTRTFSLIADGSSSRGRRAFESAASDYGIVRDADVTRALLALHEATVRDERPTRLCAALRRVFAAIMRNRAPAWGTSGLDRVASALERDPFLTTVELARQNRMHPVALARAFRRRFGLAPMAFARRIRVERAATSLMAGAALVDAAVNAGFADQPHLTRAFGTAFGTTPAAYRAAIDRA